MPETKSNYTQIITIVAFLIMFGGSVAGWASSNATLKARINNLEITVSENKQELDDNNLKLINYKLTVIDDRLDKIMTKLNIQ